MRKIVLPGRNHFVVPEELNDAKTELSQAVLTMMKATG